MLIAIDRLRRAAPAVVGLVAWSFSGCAPKVASPAAETALTLSADAQTLPRGRKVAAFELEKGGVVEIIIHDAVAPKTAAHFEELVRRGFYDRAAFVYADAVVVRASGAGGRGAAAAPRPPLPGDNVGLDAATLKTDRWFCVRGAVVAPRPPRTVAGNPGEFWILKKDMPELDGKVCIFGGVVGLLAVVDGIRAGEVIKRARILRTGD